MATLGKSIRIYLKDGTVTGIRIAEVVNQTIQSIACPRNRITELRNDDEATRPGIYFLFGNDEKTGDNKVYIGEAENVFDRLQNHLSTKEFWNEVIFFVSKDENLTKSHVKYLESRIIQIAKATKRYIIENDNQPQLSSLPRADVDAMEEFFIYIKLLIGVLGHKFLEELNPIKEFKIVDQLDSTHTRVTQDQQFTAINKVLELSLSASGFKAKAVQTDEGIVVLQGSEAAETIKGLQDGYKELRDRLINNETLVLKGDKYIFQKNHLFNTPSPAASIIVGYNINGRQAWKNSSGITLKQIEERKVTPTN